MAHKTKMAPAARKRHNDSFKDRYGMTQKEYRALKKENPEEAFKLRTHAYQRFLGKK